jgi:fucose 4-O-acetylase-like acetyltransferase
MNGSFFGGQPSPKAAIDLWLHSFRMPMFFLISGFFASMMLGKYGVRKYLVRRWWRIGIPLLVSLAMLFIFRYSVDAFRASQSPTGFGPQVGFGPAMGGPPPGFGPPPPGFGPPNGATPFPAPPFPSPPVDFQKLPVPPSSAWSQALFGDQSKYLRLEHLWFLWYLFVMVTLAPFVVWFIARVISPVQGTFDRISRGALRWNAAPIVLTAITLPALIHARGFLGWSLANPHGFLGTFPDFIVMYYPDWPFYSFYFLAGWWLFRHRDLLSSIRENWKWSLALGITFFAASYWLSNRYSNATTVPNYERIRIGGFFLYGLGTAYSTWGFLGFFQRYLSRPSPVVRYLADTALWVYLVHLPLIPYVIGWVEPHRTSWWEATAGGVVLVTAISLILYELFVRPTPLIYIYGPATMPSKENSTRPLS